MRILTQRDKAKSKRNDRPRKTIPEETWTADGAAETRESPVDLRSAKQVNAVNRADRFSKVQPVKIRINWLGVV